MPSGLKGTLRDLPLSTAAFQKDWTFIKRKARFYAGRAVIAAGLQQGHQDYTRFIILGSARTGSTYLRSMLNSHSRIICVGELFNGVPGISWQIPGYFQVPWQLRLYERDPDRFLERYVYGPAPDCIRAGGFKIFYFHAGQPAKSPVWQHLKTNNKIKVIHLTRKNQLNTYLSLKKSLLTGQFFVRSSKSIREPVVSLSAEGCRRFFKALSVNIDHFNLFFKDHPLLEISYENLAANQASEMSRVLAFLETPHESLVSRSVKQARLPLHMALANYEQLKREFKGSQWGHFFED